MARNTDHVPVLDHGYVRLVEAWGHGDSGYCADDRTFLADDCERGIVEAARQSTSGTFRGWGPVARCRNCGVAFDAPESPCPNPSGTRPYVDCGRGGHHFEEAPGDERLLGFLARNRHDTPFEFAGMVVEVRAPIFVLREWHRHRTQSYNEASARYAPLPDQNYVPSVERLLSAGEGNRQSGAVPEAPPLDEAAARRFQEALRTEYDHDEAVYQASLAAGVPKELARLVLPVGRYSQMRAAANLRNWLAFVALRSAPDAQWEMRQYAAAVGAILARSFPRTWAVRSQGGK